MWPAAPAVCGVHNTQAIVSHAHAEYPHFLHILIPGVVVPADTLTRLTLVSEVTVVRETGREVGTGRQVDC